jgi:hypothetical protein
MLHVESASHLWRDVWALAVRATFSPWTRCICHCEKDLKAMPQFASLIQHQRQAIGPICRYRTGVAKGTHPEPGFLSIEARLALGACHQLLCKLEFHPPGVGQLPRLLRLVKMGDRVANLHDCIAVNGLPFFVYHPPIAPIATQCRIALCPPQGRFIQIGSQSL